MVKYEYNNTIHTSTGKTPFEIVEERLKLPLLMVKYLGNVFAADEYRQALIELIKRLRILSPLQSKRKIL